MKNTRLAHEEQTSNMINNQAKQRTRDTQEEQASGTKSEQAARGAKEVHERGGQNRELPRQDRRRVGVELGLPEGPDTI